jgi:hypothetical protein
VVGEEGRKFDPHYEYLSFMLDPDGPYQELVTQFCAALRANNWDAFINWMNAKCRAQDEQQRGRFLVNFWYYLILRYSLP